MEQLLFAVQIMVLGFSVVLLTLFLLFLLIALMGRFIGLASTNFSRGTTVTPQVHNLHTIDPAKVAAISAVLYGYLEKNYRHKSFRICHIERMTPYKNSWLREGRKELLYMNDEVEKRRREKHGQKIL